MQRFAMLFGCVSVVGCAHLSLSRSELDRVKRPAFIGRIEEEGGPKSLVYRQDRTYASKLNRVEPKEADRRLQVKLTQAVSRFEVADRLRAVVLSRLPREPPWSNVVDPVQVANVLESYLVQEVPANPPDYELLKPLGADAVVEFVIEEFGLRCDSGRCGVFVTGYGRMFSLGGSEIWRSHFSVDRSHARDASLDPFAVAQEPDAFRRQLAAVLDGVGERFAQELNPPKAPASEQTQPLGIER
jgi:hypothetical protein